MRVLVIDDGPAGDDIAHHLRAMYGSETFRAKSIADGLRMSVEVADVDYIVLDLSLPDSSREQTIGYIPKLKETAPVFVFTGYEDRELMQKSLDIGADDVFLKGDNHKGASALASRLASIAYRKKPGNGTAERILSSLLKDRKIITRADKPKLEWFRSPWASISLFITQIGVLVVLVWNAAMFSRQVALNTTDIIYLKQRDEIVKMENKGSADNRATLDKRMDKFDERMNGFDTKIDGIKTDIGNLPWKIRDLMNEDKKH